MTGLLKVAGLRLYYAVPGGVIRAVDDVSFTLEEGEALGVVGESGAGKSSLAMALMRLLPPNVATYSGLVELEGTDCTALKEEDFRKQVRWKRMSMVFQGAMESLNPVVKAGQQVAEPLLLDYHLSRRKAYKEVTDLLQKVLLPREVFHRYPHELSGGMKQRVVIAMALVLRPRLLILDEPTSALDVSVQAQVMNLLKQLKREMGLSFLFITHDIALASDLCDSISVMYGGELVEKGTAEQLLTTPAHPYTRKLLASIPRLASDATPEFIPGAPPDLSAPPPGCRFHPRCPHAFDRCRGEKPPPVMLAPGHEARCWLWDRER